MRRFRKKVRRFVRLYWFWVSLGLVLTKVSVEAAYIERGWDNKKVWQALESKGFQIMSGLDVIEYTLKAGEKDRIIDSFSGRIWRTSGILCTLCTLHLIKSVSKEACIKAK